MLELDSDDGNGHIELGQIGPLCSIVDVQVVRTWSDVSRGHVQTSVNIVIVSRLLVGAVLWMGLGLDGSLFLFYWSCINTWSRAQIISVCTKM